MTAGFRNSPDTAHKLSLSVVPLVNPELPGAKVRSLDSGAFGFLDKGRQFFSTGEPDGVGPALTRAGVLRDIAADRR